MNDVAQVFLNPYVLFYLSSVAGVQMIYAQLKRKQKDLIAIQRRTRGLPNGILLNRPERLAALRQRAFLESALLLLTIVGLPFLLSIAISLLEGAESSGRERLGLMLAFVGLLMTMLWSAKGPLLAFVGGLAFKTFATFAVPFEIGDRVTIRGFSGKVISLSTFLFELETPRGERVSLPTYLLWNEMVVSEGDRATQCEINLYLSLCASAHQRRVAESFLQELIQSSTYLEPSKPVQIYFTAGLSATHLTAVAYAVSAEHARSLSNEITKEFLSFSQKEQIAL